MQLKKRCGSCYRSLQVQSSDMDATAEVVVVPGTRYCAEVIIDRGGSVGDPVANYSSAEGLAWGLGYVTDQNEASKVTADGEKLDRNDVPATTSSANPPPLDPGPWRKQKGKQKSAQGKETRRRGQQNKPRRAAADPTQGFLSVGGLKIYTEDISEPSSDDDSCTEQMDEGDADEDNSFIGLLRKDVRLNNKRGKNRRKNRSSSPDRQRFSAIMLDSSDGEESSYESSDSDISDELVDDYLTNCEGLAADINDPSWVIHNQKSLQYPNIDEMDIQDEEGDSSSEEEDFDPESLEERYRRKLIRREGNDPEAADGGDSDVETEDLEQKVFFGYDSDTSSCTGSETEDALLSDDETRIRDLELDDEARIRDLELQEKAALRLKEGEDVEPETILPTSSVGTQTLAAAADEAGHGGTKFVSSRSGMVPKYRSVGQFVSGSVEEVSVSTPVPAQAWPFSRGKAVKKTKGIPGQKKLERKKTVREKRIQRAAKRGFDIDAVNKMLEDMVRQKKDVIAFEPMIPFDRKMVHTLAKFYKLNGASQGTMKRRFVVVSITQNTCMPSGEEKIRLLKFLGRYKYSSLEDEVSSSRPLTGEERRKQSKKKRAARQALQEMETPRSRKNRTKTPDSSERFAGKTGGKKGSSSASGSHAKKSGKKGSRTTVLYANNPVSFVGRGMESEDACITPAIAGLPTTVAIIEQMTRPRLPKVDPGSSVRQSTSTEFAVFEAHTTGFASKMMAKMGYVEGRGLGREKQGIAQPLEAVIRPKSLGLGARV
ncbi:hypothetical protein R1sor_022196 [Riccia sorocarpa]|uniref:Protein SQS1 n=1 Tax=Riccia sorocarpa TaxID=122646 RepID=A0ABD3GMH8_9MARC